MPKHMTPRLLKAYAEHNHAPEHGWYVGREHVVCPQCRAPIVLFGDVAPERKHAIAATRGGSLEGVKLAMRDLCAETGCDLAQAKANVTHLRKPGSICHACDHVLPRGALLCAQCMSVNLDWQA